jgi:uncharacterized protein YpuA (DUF1002 family)
MQDAAKKSSRDFAEIQREIEQLTTRLNTVNHPESRRELLRQMRILLQELTDAANSL